VGVLRRYAVAALLVVGVLGFASPAQAAPIDVNFNNVTGSTFLAKPKTTVEVPKSSITTKVDLDAGTLTGQVNIPNLTAHLNLLSLLNVTSIVKIVPVGDLTGTIDLGASKLSTTTRFTLQILDVHLNATPQINLVSSTCRTITPTTLTLTNTTPVDIFNGTTVTGSYTIPPFTRCGLLTPLLTLLLSGPGNTMTLVLK